MYLFLIGIVSVVTEKSNASVHAASYEPYLPYLDSRY